MDQVMQIIVGVVVALLGGDRALAVYRNRRNSGNPGQVTKQDVAEIKASIMTLRDEVAALNGQMQRHLGYHEGVRGA